MTINQPVATAWRSLSGVAALAVLTLTVATSQAATVAEWNFEDGRPGYEFTGAGLPNGSGGSADLVNGTVMYGFSEAAGPRFTANTASGSGLAMNLEVGVGPSVTSDGYVFEGDLLQWSPTEWTIETHALLRDIAGWNSLIGKDGSSTDPAVSESDFYLQNNGLVDSAEGIDDYYRVNFATVGGARHILDAAPAGGIQPDQWYGVAVTSDGATLSMYFDDGSGYTLADTLDISAQTPEQNALLPSDLTWTFGRAWFGGNQVDHINGMMDNIRFSDTALAANELIPLNLDPGFEVVGAPGMSLVVDPDTGEAVLRNDSSGAIGLDYYRVDSVAGDLDTAGWNSLDDQDLDSLGPNPGESWDEVPNALSANLLVEQFLTGETTLAPGASVAIGSPYSGSGPGDLTFQYSGGGGLLDGVVLYQDLIENPGDFNNDGVVDGADYAFYRDAEATQNLAADHSGDGVVDITDRNIWSANHGAVYGTSLAVPEPSAVVSVLLVSLAGLARRRG